MSSMQKPFANDRRPDPAPAPKKKTGFFGKLVRLVVLAAIAAGVFSVYIHAKNVGESRAIASGHYASDEDARQHATLVLPWDWTSTERNSYVTMVNEMVRRGTSVASAKAMTLKAKATAFVEQRRGGATPAASVAVEPSAPAPAPSSTAPAPAASAPSGPAPAGFDDASKLVEEGEVAWEANNFEVAKQKLGDAIAQLKPMAEKDPKNERVAKALDLANQLMEDITKR
jgi:hypothetical protein